VQAAERRSCGHLSPIAQRAPRKPSDRIRLQQSFRPGWEEAQRKFTSALAALLAHEERYYHRVDKDLYTLLQCTHVTEEHDLDNIVQQNTG
jgi:hypothetical protein